MTLKASMYYLELPLELPQFYYFFDMAGFPSIFDPTLELFE